MKTLLFMTAALAGSLAFGTVRYVDDAAGVDDTSHGTATNNAYKTIQYAVDQAEENDVILVLPGEYRSGGLDDGTMMNRVYIKKSNLTLIGVAGKDRTKIVGETPDDFAANMAGGVRCVRTKDAKVTNVVMRAFTLCDGAAESGGAAYVGGDKSYSLALVDCEVTRCVGSKAVLWCASLVRTRVVGNAFDSVLCRGGRYCFSVFAQNLGGSTLIAYPERAVNCTFAANTFSDSSLKYHAVDGDIAAYNCLFLGGHPSPSSTSANSWLLVNCVATANDQYSKPDSAASNTVFSVTAQQLLNLSAGDYRPLADSVSATNGNAKYLHILPETCRGTDLLGNAVPTTGPIAVGAIAAATTPVCGIKTDWKDGVFTVDGAETGGETAYYDTWPKQVRIKATPADGKPIVFYGIHGLYPLPDKDGSALVTLAPGGQVTAVNVYPATDVLYVDKTTGDDGYDGRSAEVGAADPDSGIVAGPKRTIQAAVDAAPTSEKLSGSRSVIYVAPQVYDEGGAFLYGSNRVCVAGRFLRIVSTGSAEDTIIAGAADPETAEDGELKGTGTNAIRCVYWDVAQGGLQGFTLTGGHTRNNTNPDSSEYPRRGGAFCSYNGRYPVVADCILSNNVGNIGSTVYGGWYNRCRILENDHVKDNYDTLRNCYLSSCLVDRNKLQWNPADLGASVYAYNCTVRSPSGKSVFRTTDKVTTVAMNCLFLDSSNAYANPNLAGCFYHGMTDESETSGYVAGDAAFADKDADDLRLTSRSGAIGVGLNGMEADLPHDYMRDFYARVSGDIDGNPIQFTDGKPTAGAHQKPLLALKTSGKHIAPAEGFHAVEPGATVEVTATDAARRSGWTWVVNGTSIRNGESVWPITAEDRAYGKGESVEIGIEYDPLGLMLLFR